MSESIRLLHLAPALLLGLLVPLAMAQNRPAREQVLAHLERMRATEKGMMNVAPAEGDYLSKLVQKLKAQRVLEIGTSNGYSSIWFALGLRAAGGKLLTLDIDEGRRSLALKNFRATGMDDIIESRLGDALKILPTLKGPFDLVFIDAWKPDYKKYLDIVLPLVRSGGVIAAHNVVSHSDEMQDFLAEIKTNPQLKTEIVRVGPSGLSISYKR
ncbi:MAG TPA: O-methyltransferase [Bryobacterales bacterium]|nr:O-methyltransferase [Bryobacterales bacterium]